MGISGVVVHGLEIRSPNQANTSRGAKGYMWFAFEFEDPTWSTQGELDVAANDADREHLRHNLSRHVVNTSLDSINNDHPAFAIYHTRRLLLALPLPEFINRALRRKARSSLSASTHPTEIDRQLSSAGWHLSQILASQQSGAQCSLRVRRSLQASE